MSGTGSPRAGAGAEPAHPADLLLLIDMDADTDFWVSLAGPTLSRLFPTVGGLRRIVESVVDLPWLRFTTPGTYLANHPPVAEVQFGQDTADGRFDGYSSWAEKRSSQELWTLLEQSRLYSMQARALSGRSTMEELGMEGLGLEELGMERPPADEAEALREAFERRIRGLSTTHFGMAEPIMNRTRLRTAREILEGSRDAALRALHSAGGVNPAPPPPTANQGFQ
jgi:hypothetical protein